jgi:hypothetical protein
VCSPASSLLLEGDINRKTNRQRSLVIDLGGKLDEAIWGKYGACLHGECDERGYV